MKNVKKYILAVVGLSLAATPVCTTAFAANSGGVSVGPAVVITDASVTPNRTLTLDMSPGVRLTYATNANEFALSTTNEAAQAQYRLEYAIWSPKTGYYQRPNNSTADPVVLNYNPSANLTANTYPLGTGWTYMGNGTD